MKLTTRTNALQILLATLLVGSGWLFGVLHAQNNAKSARKDFVNPTPGRFSGAVAVYSGGVKTIYVSGHTGRGDDLKSQALAAYQSLVKELQAAGAGPEDVIKL